MSASGERYKASVPARDARRTRSRSAAMDAAMNGPTFTFTSLPLELARRIFLALPVDRRAQAACVCRSWRDALADPALWTRLDISAPSGVNMTLNRDALLLGAAARASGRLQTLQTLDARAQPARGVTLPALLAVLRANAGSLCELNVSVVEIGTPAAGNQYPPALIALLKASPCLQRLHADVVVATCRYALHMLRAEAPWGPLRMRRLELCCRRRHRHDFALFAAAFADAALQPTMSALRLVNMSQADQPELLDLLLDGLLARRVPELCFARCKPKPAQLVRLLAGGALKKLGIEHSALDPAPLFDAAGAALVAAALRTNTTLELLILTDAGLYRDPTAASILLAALIGHPTLCQLMIGSEGGGAHLSLLGAAVGVIVAANAPALHTLRIMDIPLLEVGLAPLLDALPLNSHLRELDIFYTRRVCSLSREFTRDRLLPAVCANTSLRFFKCDGEPDPNVAEAVRLVDKRRLSQDR